MTDREKLIELCEDVILSCKASPCDDCEHNGIDYPKCMGVHFADHLLANGVTVQEWIPVTEKLPKDGEQVLCWYEYFRYGNYNRLYQTCGIGYQFHGNWGGEVSNGHKCRVIAWMPLPEPPKEE